jgi:hypothetical protein
MSKERFPYVTDKAEAIRICPCPEFHHRPHTICPGCPWEKGDEPDGEEVWTPATSAAQEPFVDDATFTEQTRTIRAWVSPGTVNLNLLMTELRFWLDYFESRSHDNLAIQRWKGKA